MRNFLGIVMRTLELRGRRYIKTDAMDIIRQGNLSENSGEIVVYQPDEITRLEVRLQDETVWLNRQQLATLFGRDVKTIGKHINNALAEELKDIPTIAYFATVQIEGSRYVTRDIEYYSLDMVVSIGYRVKSQKGVFADETQIGKGQ